MHESPVIKIKSDHELLSEVQRFGHDFRPKTFLKKFWWLTSFGSDTVKQVAVSLQCWNIDGQRKCREMSEHFSCSLSTRKDESCESRHWRSRISKTSGTDSESGKFRSAKASNLTYSGRLMSNQNCYIKLCSDRFCSCTEPYIWTGKQISTFTLPGSHSRKTLTLTCSRTPRKNTFPSFSYTNCHF